jgi:integrase
MARTVKEILNNQEIGDLTINRCATSKFGYGKAILTDPKSASSRHSFLLPGFLFEALKAYKPSSHSIYIFGKNTNGQPIGETTIERYIKIYSKKAGLEYINPHGFRHSCASYLANDLHLTIYQVSKWLGHASIEITSRVYVHLYPDNRNQVTALIEQNTNRRF